MRTFSLNANLRVSGAVARRVRHFLACLLHVIPNFRRATLIRLVPGLVRFVRGLIVEFTRLRIFVRFKGHDYFRRFGCRGKVVNDRQAPTFHCSIQVQSAILIANVSRYEGEIICVFLSKVVSATLTVKEADAVVVSSRSTAGVRGLSVRTRHVRLCVGL